MVSHTWTNNTWQHVSGDISIRFYYEQYDPTEVSTLIAGADINVYPVPAADNMNVVLNWDEPQDFALSLTDMSGRTVYYQSERAQRNYNKAISVSNLPAGNYVLSVAGKAALLNKQITISH